MKNKRTRVSNLGKILNKRTLQGVVIITITAAFAWFIKEHMTEIKKAFSLSPGTLILLISLSVLSRVFSGLKIRTVVRLFNVELTFVECIGCAYIANLYNYFISRSGTAMVSVYLKKKHGLNYSKFLSLFVGDVLIAFFISGVLGLVCSFYAYRQGIDGGMILSGLFAGLIAVTFVLIHMPEIRINKPGRIADTINKLLHGWNLLRKNKRTVMSLSFFNFMVMVTFALRYYIIFKVFSVHVPLFICLIIAPLSIIVQFTSVLPGAYGLREAAAGFATKAADIGFSAGAIATLVDRVIMMFVAFILGSISSFMLLGKRPALKEEGTSDE